MKEFQGYKTFNIDEYLTVECKQQRTSYGFRHLATIYHKGRQIGSAKACYYNRTWEAYEYQSVIQAAIKKAFDAGCLSDSEYAEAAEWAKQDHTDSSDLKSIAGIMALGEILGTNQREKNDWKTRMLKAGLEGRGLIMPDDWDKLDDATKETRLNAVIKTLK